LKPSPPPRTVSVLFHRSPVRSGFASHGACCGYTHAKRSVGTAHVSARVQYRQAGQPAHDLCVRNICRRNYRHQHRYVLREKIHNSALVILYSKKTTVFWAAQHGSGTRPAIVGGATRMVPACALVLRARWRCSWLRCSPPAVTC
jgi:hypothetical protein